MHYNSKPFLSLKEYEHEGVDYIRAAQALRQIGIVHKGLHHVLHMLRHIIK